MRLVVKRPNLTTLVDALIERGLIERHRHPDDGRRVDLSLTARGRALFDAATTDAERSLADLAELGDGPPRARLDAIATWSTTVEEAATLLRRTRHA